MEIVHEIAIHLKDRVLLLDKDLDKKNMDVSKRSEWCSRFHCWKGRHYKNLKQGPGWSFPLSSFPVANSGLEAPTAKSTEEEAASVPPTTEDSSVMTAPRVRTPIFSQGGAPPLPILTYEVDIPDEVRQYFRHYEEAIFERPKK